MSKYESLQSIPLYQATRFELLSLQILPWAEEWFPTAPGRPGPIVGNMTAHEIVRLNVFRQMKQMIIAALDAETTDPAVAVPRSPKPIEPPKTPPEARVGTTPIAFATDGDGSELEKK